MPILTASACAATPPPFTVVITSKVPPSSVSASGRLAEMRCSSVTK